MIMTPPLVSLSHDQLGLLNKSVAYFTWKRSTKLYSTLIWLVTCSVILSYIIQYSFC